MREERKRERERNIIMVRLTEMTFSNLRVPMFAHAGDSEDEEEDREPLVAAVEDSDED